MTRLSSYYTEYERSLALVVLDTMAGQASRHPFRSSSICASTGDPSLADEQLREVLTALAEDHYIEPRKGAGGVAYDFRWRPRQEMVEGATVMRQGFLRSSRYSPETWTASPWRPSSSDVAM